jgi:hypothetical protein
VPSPAEVDNFKKLLITLSAKAADSITSLWNQFADTDPQTRWNALEMAYPAIIDPFMAASGTLAAEWYSSLDPTADFAVEVAPPVNRDALAANVNWALTQTDVLSALVGSSERQIFNSSRETIFSNVEREGIKYARHASANACAFCRLLATRGGVYASEQAAVRVVGRGKDLSMMERRQRAAGNPLPFRPRFDSRGAAVDEGAVSLGGYKRRAGKGGKGRFIAGGSGQTRGAQKLVDKYHDNCHCMPVPVRAGTFYEPPDYAVGWQQEYFDAQDAAKAAGKTKGDFGAIDVDAVLNEMRKAQYPARKDALNARRRELYAQKQKMQGDQ